MTIAILILIFVAIGFLIAQTTTGDALAGFFGGVTQRVQDVLPQGEIADEHVPPFHQDFNHWIASAVEVPDDLRTWYLTLGAEEALRFQNSLNTYGQSTGFHVARLVNGALDQRAELRTIYVEAVSIYSQAYRKAREAAEQDNESEAPEASERPEKESPKIDGKIVAEKRPSRRRAGMQSEPAVAG